jgi:hypothetical protein
MALINFGNTGNNLMFFFLNSPVSLSPFSKLRHFSQAMIGKHLACLEIRLFTLGKRGGKGVARTRWGGKLSLPHIKTR